MHLREISKSIEDVQGGSFLEELNRKWVDHNNALQMIQDILMYMDRTFIPSTHKTPVHTLGLNLWRDNIIHSSNIQTRLLNTLLDLIQEELTERRLNEEMERVSQYLDPLSEAKIINVIEQEMIANHMHRLVHMENSGLVNMPVDDKYEDLGRMYSLFRRVPDVLSLIRDVMTSHIRDTGRQLVTDPEKSRNPVDFKDVFEKYYKQHLAKRLLSSKTVSDDAEGSLIVKLKTECGYQFTSKLDGMITDMKTSQDTMQGFHASQATNIGDGPTLVVQVLTTGSW
ncbi:hypothetical protein Scep_018392 [Stephania cephalantha]|uniref:Cullin family profile domain-containing protein n=1 Tax=Stephania cephalantha TaxID=152367 RepID=A0AAP0NL36_9MAGN